MAGSEMDCINNLTLLKAFYIISAICAALSFFICIRIIISHATNWVTAPIQSRMIMVVSLNLVCAVAFVLSIFFYKHQEFIELAIEVWVCVCLLIFYHGLIKLLVALELKNNRNAYQVTLHEARTEAPEIYKTFNEGELNHNLEFKKSTLTIMFYHLKKLKHIKLIARCREPTDTSTFELASEKVAFIDRAVVVFVVLVPLIIVAKIIVTEISHNESRLLSVLLQLVKLILTVFAMVNILQCCSNLQGVLPRHNLVGKFLALKLVIIMLLVQSAILRAVSPSYECLSSSEFAVVLNAIILSVENVILALLLNNYFYCHSIELLADTSNVPFDESSVQKL